MGWYCSCPFAGNAVTVGAAECVRRDHDARSRRTSRAESGFDKGSEGSTCPPGRASDRGVGGGG